jgi:hypothetical protein
MNEYYAVKVELHGLYMGEFYIVEGLRCASENLLGSHARRLARTPQQALEYFTDHVNNYPYVFADGFNAQLVKIALPVTQISITEVKP